jgi:hypothetical protein
MTNSDPKDGRGNKQDTGKLQNTEDATWQELMSNGDFVGLRYLRVAKLKRKRKLAKEERGFLKQFEADRKRVLRDPVSVWEKGFQRIHRELLLIEMLIHEKRAQNISEGEDVALYDAVSMFSLFAAQIRDDLIRHAGDGMPWACQAVFRDGKALASAFSRLAIASPELFRVYTEESLTMPSLRARNPGFTCDAAAIIQAVHLAEKHHASNIHDNRSRLGALCHQFVAQIVDLVAACRLEATQRGDKNSKWFGFPELRGNAKAWWNAEIKEWVQLEFEKMRRNSRHNPALWLELERITDRGTDSAKRAALEKYCFNKLEQIAGKPGSISSSR